MAVSAPFMTALARICILLLFSSAAILIPTGIFLTELSCLALNLTGYGLFFAGIYSLHILLRILFR